jgi:two-component system sensor histidine kinase BaeS
MLRSLRNRLILSHVLPLLFIIPLMGVALIYVLEGQIVIPRLAQDLAGDAKLLAEISREEYNLWGNPILFETMLNRVQLDPAERVMFLTPKGELLYSSEPEDNIYIGTTLPIAGLDLAQKGEEVVLTNYSGWQLHNVVLDSLEPVINSSQQVIGVVRLTYRVSSVYETITRMRNLVIGVLVVGMIAGILIGSALALNIGKPIQKVTGAIYDLARGNSQEPLSMQGPTEIQNQAKAVNFLLNRLHNLEQARRQLLANLVHELGRPLGALRSAIHALAQGAANDPKLLADLTSGMDDEAARLQNILNDLAHLHEQVLGTLELNRHPVALSDWLATTLIPWQQAAEEKRLHWQVEIPTDLPSISADPLRLAQIIGNLVSNAIKYTPSGRKIRVSAGVKDNSIWIAVEDKGSGITDEEQKSIFTPFYQGSQGKRIKQGMGLGLTIARDLATAHGGWIEIESTPGLGSKFTLWLPVQ